MGDCGGDAVLADGSAPATPDQLFARLKGLGIEVRTRHHPPVFTVEEAKALRGKIEGCHTKNLFLRSKKGRMYLVVCPEDRGIDLRMLARMLGAKRLSFGSGERLMKFLGVFPGAVTPFAVVNDRGGEVRVVLDRKIVGADMLNFHPLDNAMTTSIAPGDLIRFLEAENHPPEILDFD